MARKSNLARDAKRLKMIEKYAEKRAELKEAGDYEALHLLPRNSSPTRKKTAAAKLDGLEHTCDVLACHEYHLESTLQKVKYLV